MSQSYPSTPPPQDGSTGPGQYQGAPGPGQYPSGRPTDPTASTDDRVLAVLAHLSPIIAFVLSAGWLSFLGPLLIWFFFRDRSDLVRNAAATAFNFHITVWVAVIIGWICAFTVVLLPFAIVLWVLAVGAQVIFSILGAVRANRREIYKYPFQVPILK